MVPNIAMGAIQAMESCAVLVNELSTALKNSGSIKSSDVLKAALSRYTEKRIGRSTSFQKRAGVVCRALMRHDCHNKDAAAVLQNLPVLSDFDWLFKEFMGFSGSPAFADIPQSARAAFFDQALTNFQQRVTEREKGFLNCTNSELFGSQEYSALQQSQPSLATIGL